jgi:uncharacterized protein
MKGNLQARLNQLRQSGEIITGRQLSKEQHRTNSDPLFPGEEREEETAFGRCYIRELKYPLEHIHGSSALYGILSCCGSNLSLTARDNRLDNFDPCRSIFLDIETTGLAGGTGTWAFLIGVGWVEQNYFLLRQYFLRRPAEERAILSHFAAEAAAYPTLITFNGKLFDLPLIQTRQLLSGFRQTEPQIHLDLLHCARTLWKKRLPSRSLRSLEESLLGLRRYDDIPGAEIPAVYFDYLRRGKTDRLKTVFHHNVLDILSMVTLLERISLLGSGQLVEHPAEALALGRLFMAAGKIEEGTSYLYDAAKSGPGELADEAALTLAFYHKRAGRWFEAVEIWHKLAVKDQANSVALIELAKYYEHRIRDYKAALDLTTRALFLLTKPHCIESSSGELSRNALLHRQNRLEKRISNLNFLTTN